MSEVIMLNVSSNLFPPQANCWARLWYEMCLRGWEMKRYTSLC